MKPEKYRFEEGDAVIVYNELLCEWCGAIIKRINDDNSVELDCYSVNSGIVHYTVIYDELADFHEALNESQEMKTYLDEKDMVYFYEDDEIVYYDDYGMPHRGTIDSIRKHDNYDIKTFPGDVYKNIPGDKVRMWQKKFLDELKYKLLSQITYNSQDWTVVNAELIESESEESSILYEIKLNGKDVWQNVTEKQLDESVND